MVVNAMGQVERHPTDLARWRAFLAEFKIPATETSGTELTPFARGDGVYDHRVAPPDPPRVALTVTDDAGEPVDAYAGFKLTAVFDRATGAFIRVMLYEEP